MWTRWFRYVAILALEGTFGSALLRFGPAMLGAQDATAIVTAVLLTAANTALLAWLMGSSVRPAWRVMACLGVFAGSAIACAGASRPPETTAWAVLTLLGVFANLEICRFATAVSGPFQQVPWTERLAEGCALEVDSRAPAWPAQTDSLAQLGADKPRDSHAGSALGVVPSSVPPAGGTHSPA
jgi:hypothetical protein